MALFEQEFGEAQSTNADLEPTPAGAVGFTFDAIRFECFTFGGDSEAGELKRMIELNGKDETKVENQFFP